MGGIFSQAPRQGWKRIELRAGLSHQPASHKGSNDLTLGGGTWKEAIASAAL